MKRRFCFISYDEYKDCVTAMIEMKDRQMDNDKKLIVEEVDHIMEGKCFNCHEMGHWKGECPNPAAKDKRPEDTGTNVYVTGFPDNFTDRALEQIFSKFGEIKDIRRKHDFAYVEYTDYFFAIDAAREMDGFVLNPGEHLTVQQSSKMTETECYLCDEKGHLAKDCPKTTRHYKPRSGLTKIFVSKYPGHYQERDFKLLFQHFGPMAEISVKDSYTFINFEHFLDAEDAVAGLSGKTIDADDKVYVINVEESSDGGSGQQCESCGGYGHIAFKCPYRQKYNLRHVDHQYEARFMTNNRAVGNDAMACYNCGDRGHFSTECPKPKKFYRQPDENTKRYKLVSRSRTRSNSLNRKHRKMEYEFDAFREKIVAKKKGQFGLAEFTKLNVPPAHFSGQYK
jgi:RNA recognition motif-containing protein